MFALYSHFLYSDLLYLTWPAVSGLKNLRCSFAT